MSSIAARARPSGAAGLFGILLMVWATSGCSGLPDKPTRATMYDFGPGPLATQPSTRQAPLPPLALDDVATSGGALDNMAVLYRLGYADAQQLRPYSQARWSMPPAQLVRQRLREQLGLRRAVFSAGSSVALNRSQNAVLPLLLRLDLEEFSHLFTAPDTSVGLIRLRATLLEITPAGEKLVGQRNIVVQRPASSSDAPGGVRALTAATDAAIEELDQWLQQTPAR
ncbi:ABC-type transport auxiliary lipoprotein family protein [Polaromonas sp.]|uniref:ABC-type transport auxiliary lipoprotein family protein n=1 Tax=Polaromonas sp. TaxID=1869339 RepID=UPI0032672587